MDPKTVYESRAEVQLVDVREDDEWAAGRIDSALHIPMSDLPGRLEQIDSNRTVVVICRVGQRSAAVAEYLNRSGYTAHNLDGGLQRWTAAGFPLTTATGEPGHVA